MSVITTVNTTVRTMIADKGEACLCPLGIEC